MNKSTRIHGIDAVRAVAMWLGVLLHAVIAYKATPEPGWPKDYQLNSLALDWLYNIIHSFRMPIFFLIAGFFARMVILRSGMVFFARQRLTRIVLPFIVGILLIVPLTLFPFHYYRFHYNLAQDQILSIQKSISLLFQWDGIAHLWFLYYLILFYMACIPVYYLFPNRFQKLKIRFSNYISKISMLQITILVIILASILFFQQAFTPPVYAGLKPQLFHFLYYGLFFFTGWLMQFNSNSILSLQKKCFLLCTIGLALSFMPYLIEFEKLRGATYLIFSIQSVFLTLGLTGFLIYFVQNANQSLRYFSDSAYWVYLMHMGIVAILQVLFLNSPIHPLLRMPLILIITSLVCMISYRYFVRYTFIGKVLHGSREKKVPTSGFLAKKIASEKKSN